MYCISSETVVCVDIMGTTAFSPLPMAQKRECPKDCSTFARKVTIAKIDRTNGIVSVASTDLQQHNYSFEPNAPLPSHLEWKTQRNVHFQENIVKKSASRHIASARNNLGYRMAFLWMACDRHSIMRTHKWRTNKSREQKWMCVLGCLGLTHHNFNRCVQTYYEWTSHMGRKLCIRETIKIFGWHRRWHVWMASFRQLLFTGSWVNNRLACLFIVSLPRFWFDRKHSAQERCPSR